MRIVAGAARGRPLQAPPGRDTRPTSDRAREALFSTVESLLDGLGGRRVLDLYAGSGAVGLEALSRGAAAVSLVERDATAAAVIRRNVEAVGLPGATVVVTAVERMLTGSAPVAYDLVFVDPPYALDVTGVLAGLAEGGWLGSGGLLVVERASRDPDLTWPPGVDPVRSRRYGEATLWYGRRAVGGESL